MSKLYMKLPTVRLTWFSCPMPAKIPKGISRKAMKAGCTTVVDELGEIYASALIVGHEMHVFFCASHDGVKIIVGDDNHAYYPVDWMQREFPDVKETLEAVKQQVRAAISRSEAT